MKEVDQKISVMQEDEESGRREEGVSAEVDEQDAQRGTVQAADTEG